MNRRLLRFVIALSVTLVSARGMLAQPASKGSSNKSAVKERETGSGASGSSDQAQKADPQLKRIAPEHEVWIDQKNKQVVVGGEVCLTRGMLEMFACLKGTKEHESIVAANTAAQIVHAALLAIGAEAGSPVKFEPEYKPANGTEIAITVEWTDKDGKRQTAKAQDWIRHIKTQETMKYAWVFAGSGFWEDEDTGKKHYMAEGGDFICVSNFPSATLDLPVKSPADNSELQYEAYTERIPERGTKVRLFLKPLLAEKDRSPTREANLKAKTEQ